MAAYEGERKDGTRASVRRVARALAVASHSHSIDALKEPKIGVARLTAGLDPDTVDADSAEFRFGAGEALATLLNALAEQMLSTSAVELLRKSQRARVLNAIAAHPGATQKQLAERLAIKESNLSHYVQELSRAGLVEPSLPPEPPGKAWALSPWGLQTFFGLISGPLAGQIPEAELTQGLQGAVRQRGDSGGRDGGGPVPIPKNEVYRRLNEALSRESEEPVRLTTFYGGDLRAHKRPWRLHERVFKQGDVQRPVEWILLNSKVTKPWVRYLIEHAEGNSHVSVWSIDELEDPVPTVQVLDEEGLLYPLPPNDTGLVESREEALAAWEQHRKGAQPELVRGKPALAGARSRR